jgi:hypothetical protein
VGVLTDLYVFDRRLNSRDHLRAAFHTESDPGFATFSVSVTTPTPRPRAKTTTGVRRGPTVSLKNMMGPLQFAEDGVPPSMLDSAIDRHEDH